MLPFFVWLTTFNNLLCLLAYKAHTICSFTFYNPLKSHFNSFCSYQKAIEDITKRMGAGMGEFICKEVCESYLSWIKQSMNSWYLHIISASLSNCICFVGCQTSALLPSTQRTLNSLRKKRKSQFAIFLIVMLDQLPWLFP